MACIYYHPEAYTITGPKLMGRHAAGESFLRGFLKYTSASEFWIQVEQWKHAQQFSDAVEFSEQIKPVHAVDKLHLDKLKQPGLVYFPGPGIGIHARQRAAFGHESWSLCGITHTTSSATAMDAITDLLTSPVQSWDALICTSHAVKQNVQRVLQAEADYLKERLGITKLVLPQLPVIPLGIHTQDFVFSNEDRIAARHRLGVDSDTLVVLFTGRLSFHAKAHPLSMYQALESASKTTGKNVVLVECGWHATESIAKAFDEAAALACPSIRVLPLDGRKSVDRKNAWAGADIFCSLSDNIQETFGIVPIEAMASGLPVVVSDWDGYKDTVRDGIDGFRIPTHMPQAGLGRDLALRYALGVDSYDMYCGYTSSLIAVDVRAATRAFIRLFESPELRRAMGEAGRIRARTNYDWSAIIPQYEALWEHQRTVREMGSHKKDATQKVWPARMDPFDAFSTYPTHHVTLETLVNPLFTDHEEVLFRLRSYRQLAMVDFAKRLFPSENEIKQLVLRLDSGPKTAADLIMGFEARRQPYLLRSLAWLAKLGVLELNS